MPPRPFDVCVLGGGPAGWAGAVRAWDLGKKVCLVERREGLGGAAVWGGAMGKHVMCEVGLGLRKARPHLTGAVAADADARAWAEVRRRTRLAIIDRAHHLDQQLFGLGQTHRFNRPALKRSEKSGTIQRWKGEGVFISPNAVRLEGAGDEVIEAEHFLIATGSVPRPLAKFALDGEFIVTPQQLLKASNTVPQCVLVLGAGMEGCETATVLASLGTPAVHLVNDDSAILPREDDDVSFFIQEALASDGVKVHNEAVLEFAKIHHDRGLIECRIVESRWLEPRHHRGPPVRNRVPKTIWADKLVLCNGRLPNTKNLALEVAGVQVDSQGGILVDQLNRSVSAQHVCAAGDVVGGGRAGGLTAIAEMQSRWAMEKLLSPDGPYVRPVYRGVSSVLQVTPEMAFVGMSEAEAQRRRLPHIAAKVVMSDYAIGVIRKYGSVGTKNDKWLERRDAVSAPLPVSPGVGPEEDADILAAVAASTQAPAGGGGAGANGDGLLIEEAQRTLEEEAEAAEAEADEALGFVKIVVADDGSWSLLGLRAAGEGARSALQVASILIGTRQHVQTLAAAPHPHPSVSEAVQECVRMVLGASLHKEHLTPDSRSYVRVFRPPETGAQEAADPAVALAGSSSLSDPTGAAMGREEMDMLQQSSRQRNLDENKACLVPNYLS